MSIDQLLLLPPGYGFDSAAAPSPLLTDLVAWWDFENANDSHTNALTLTNNNSATFTAGKVGNAATLVAASSQYFSRAAHAAMQSSGGDFAIAMWIKATSLAGILHPISRWSGASDDWQCQINTDGSILWRVYNNSGSGDAFIDATKAAGTIITDTWYMLYLEYDAATKKAGVSINNGTLSQSAAGSFTTRGNDSKNLLIGELQGIGRYWSGQIDVTAYRLAKFTTDDLTEFYNGGDGIAYPG